ncbi:hypothetical protein GCM10022381_24700 [Leifsonia kafniensis]|uniref:LPXTG cell wall anchor domain-containing protein n=1 Tax=Leifsonia kafniensis TaxID=475957 RepID=A0ABP7KLW2_9MICO
MSGSVTTRTLSTFLALGAAAALALGGAVAPASAASDQILVSADGVHWSKSLGTDLFADAGLLIPKGSQSATLWVKNPTAKSAEVRLSARDVLFSSSDFATNVTIGAWNSVDDTTLSTPGDKVSKCEVLVDSQPLAAGGILKAVVTLTMADVSDRIAQDAGVSLNVMVAMRDKAAGPFPESACDDSGVIVGPDPDPKPKPTPTPTTMPTATATPTATPTTPSGTVTGSGTGTAKPLAQTGADAASPALVVVGLVGGGILFFLIGRRRRKTDVS